MQSYTTVYSAGSRKYTDLIHILHCVTKHKDWRSRSSSECLQQLFLKTGEEDHYPLKSGTHTYVTDV